MAFVDQNREADLRFRKALSGGEAAVNQNVQLKDATILSTRDLDLKKLKSEVSLNNKRSDNNNQVKKLNIDDKLVDNLNKEIELEELEIKQSRQAAEKDHSVSILTDEFTWLREDPPKPKEPEYVVRQKTIPKSVLGGVLGIGGLLILLVLVNFGKAMLRL
jgi:hypothetical protein